MKTSKLILPFIISVLNIYDICSQTEFAVSSIPDSLKTDAYSIIRLSKSSFIYQSQENGEHYCSRIITILDSKGKEEANFYCYADKFRDLYKFSGDLYDKEGKLIRKIKKNELRFTESSAELASDSKIYYFECNAPAYPFTIKYEWEIKYKNGVISFPVFFPLSDYNQSLQTASYGITIPKDVEFNYKSFNLAGMPKDFIGESSLIKQWNISNIKAIENESFGPTLAELSPRILAAPRYFTYDGKAGEMNNWKSFGLWQYELLNGRNTLPEQFKTKLKELVKDKKSDREKVKEIYDYLGKTTRYVSIQLGIGGLQPIPASEVHKTGFGDCKGLSNYMKAMLEELNIPSYYTVISTTNKSLTKDFASANQMNHVILQVPLPSDTLWLECTNPRLPFGYIHSNIAGHTGLLIKESGGEVCQLPSYPDSCNTESQKIDINLYENGKVSAHIDSQSHLFQYEDKKGFIYLNPNEQTDYLRKGINITQAKINNISFTENTDTYPSINIRYDMESEQYGNKTGNRLFIPTNAFRKGFHKYNTQKRKYNIHINYGYNDYDTIIFHIPDNYVIESLPKAVDLNTTFGRFSSSIKQENNNTIIITQNLYIHTGKYEVSTYPLFAQFCQAVTKAYSEKIILKRQNGN